LNFYRNQDSYKKINTYIQQKILIYFYIVNFSQMPHETTVSHEQKFTCTNNNYVRYVPAPALTESTLQMPHESTVAHEQRFTIESPMIARSRTYSLFDTVQPVEEEQPVRRVSIYLCYITYISNPGHSL
jgi:hypothetical protein